MSTQQEKVEKVDPSTGQFVDPLFAIFIAAAVAETIVAWTNGSAYQVSLFQLIVVIVGFFNILLSWFGYHKSVARKPIKGSLRFILTVVLLPLYMLTIILYGKDLIYVMAIYGLIFFVWCLWEYLRDIEHVKSPNLIKLCLRSYNIIVLVALGYLFIIDHLPDEFHEYWWVQYADGISLFLLILAIIWLRISKSVSNKDSPLARIKEESLNLLFGDRK